MAGLFLAIKEVFGFLTVLNDSTQRRERYTLVLEQRARKALHYAERIIELVDGHLGGELSEQRFKQSYKWYKKQFNLYD